MIPPGRSDFAMFNYVIALICGLIKMNILLHEEELSDAGSQKDKPTFLTMDIRRTLDTRKAPRQSHVRGVAVPRAASLIGP
jgi:hypothetical protein